MSTERLRAKLIKAGYDEDEVFEMDRSELLSTYAEYLLSPPIPESPEKAEGGAAGGMSAEEWEFRKQELELRKQEFEFQKERQEKEEERRQGELEMRKQEEERKKQELEIRRQEREEDLDRQRQRDELELQRREEENQRRDRENEIREMELQRQRAKDEAERKRQESMAGQTRFYGEALKHSLPKMGLDPIEFPSYFASVENLFSLYEVPPQLQSKLLIPMLNERNISLLAKLPKKRLDKYVEVRDYLLREFKLTAEQYRERFKTAVKSLTETYTLFGSRVKNLFLYYLQNRKAKTAEQIIDLLVSDRIKETLSPACLRHVLSTEGTGWCDPEKLTEVIDTYLLGNVEMVTDDKDAQIESEACHESNIISDDPESLDPVSRDVRDEHDVSA